MFRRIGLVPLVSCSAGAVIAQVDVRAAEACFTAADDPATCVVGAQDPCLDKAGETPAVATLCFTETRAEWSAALGARMRDLMADSDPRLAAVAQIETKYDLLTNLLQCDRLRDLALATSDAPDPTIALNYARCQSTASGLSYMRLFLRSRGTAKEPLK